MFIVNILIRAVRTAFPIGSLFEYPLEQNLTNLNRNSSKGYPFDRKNLAEFRGEPAKPMYL